MDPSPPGVAALHFSNVIGSRTLVASQSFVPDGVLMGRARRERALLLKLLRTCAVWGGGWRVGLRAAPLAGEGVGVALLSTACGVRRVKSTKIMSVRSREQPTATRATPATTSLLSHLVCALCLRFALILYGEHDDFVEVRYTDVNYDVFSDAAELVWNGQSPFARPTYRYTPLLALLLTPNTFVHPAFGKVLFAGCDLLVGLHFL